MRRPIFASFLAFSPLVFGENLTTEERLYDLEAQVETLKAEISTTKDQAMQEKPNAFNPSISVVGDVVGQVGFGAEKPTDEHAHDHGHGHDEGFYNGLLLREIEFEFRGAIDPIADALFIMGVGSHGDHVHVHVEEANLLFKSLPGIGYAPLGMNIKVGRFKTAIGRMNRVHLHNAPQIYYPKAMTQFLGDEGYASQGLSLNLSFNPFSKSALTIFSELLFGSRLPMQQEGAEKMVSGVGHLWWHQELTDEQYLDVGFSTVLGRKGSKDSGTFAMLSADAHYSYLPNGFGQDPLFLVGSEFYTANVGEKRWPIGYYSWAQARIFSGTFFGLLYDLAPKKEELEKFEHSVGGFLTYYSSEFLRFRLGYEHVMPNTNSFKGEERLMLSMIFILGSHPMEPYFINR